MAVSYFEIGPNGQAVPGSPALRHSRLDSGWSIIQAGPMALHALGIGFGSHRGQACSTEVERGYLLCSQR